MSGLPPGLLYLVIYNPTLKPGGDATSDDEDAEEQAHILFYTAKHRAVSRDKMLRQVGLAKALVGFSSITGSQSVCDSVHSLTRRMVMLSPEPNFWIHACIELAKRPHPSLKANGKGKSKDIPPPTHFDYYDSSVHDRVMRSQLFRGYESFKISHGSFTSILITQGKEALELQLERFFTVWAWTWNMEDSTNFDEYFGTPVHPLSIHLIPFIDALEPYMPQNVMPLVLSPPYVITKQCSQAPYPNSLIPHLQSLMPPTSPPFDSQTVATPTSFSNESQLAKEKELQRSDISPRDNGSSLNEVNGAGSMSFLNVPSINMKMDVRKWNWPGYLTFGIGGDSQGRKSTATAGDQHHPSYAQQLSTEPESARVAQDQQVEENEHQHESEPLLGVSEFEVDPHALEEALASDTRIILPAPCLAVPSEDVPSSPSQTQATFSETFVHICSDDLLITRRKKVFYLKDSGLLFALVPMHESDDDSSFNEERLGSLAEKSLDVMKTLRELIDLEQKKTADAFSTSSVKNMLQKSVHLVTTPCHLTYSTTDFSSSSGQVHEGQQLLESSLDFVEVFSRGQNPQYWYVVKRGLGVDRCGFVLGGNVYLEIRRKEASLTDVDNELAGVIRRFMHW